MNARMLVLCSLAICFGGESSAHGGDFKVGLAKVTITPDGPLWLSGYGARTRPAEGKANDLYAKAVAFESSDGNGESTAGSRLVLVTLDLGSVSPYMTSHVAVETEKRFNLPRGSLVLNCSHTHCAPEVAAERRVFHDLSEDEQAKLVRYIEGLVEKLVDLVGAALADLRPAALSVSRAEADFAFNRRHPSGIDRDGVTDREVPVLRIMDAGGKLRGVLFGYACHNTTLDFQKYCGDYAGFAQQYIEEAHPSAIALFMMGCGGDQNPQPRHGPKGLDHAQTHGRALAAAVERALASEQRAVQGPLRVAYDVATLELEPLPPLDQLRGANRARDKTADRKVRYLQGLIDAGQEIPSTQPCPLHVARFGADLLVIFISGETVVDYALRCKREFAGSAGPAVWVAGYCDDVFAYLPSRRVLLEGGYEGRDSIVHQLMATPFLPSVEERVMAGITKLVTQVSGDAK